MGSVEQSLAVQQFTNAHQDYDATPQNFQALQAAMQEFGLPWNYKGLTLAYSHAKASGYIQPSQPEAEAQPSYDFSQSPRRPGVPAVPRGQANATSVEQDENLPRTAPVRRLSGLTVTRFFLSPPPIPRTSSAKGVMNYQVDLDPVHSVVRLIVTAEIMTLEMAQDIHTRLTRPDGDENSSVGCAISQ